jgi:hypothetical protein
MDCSEDISAFRRRISQPLLMISAGFFYAYIFLLATCIWFIVQRIVILPESVALIFIEIFLVLTLVLPVIGGIFLARERREQHSVWQYAIPIVFVSCMNAISGILIFYNTYLILKNNTYLIASYLTVGNILQILFTVGLTLLPATAWYLLQGIQKTTGEISPARIRIVAGVGIAGIVSLVFCLSISFLYPLTQATSLAALENIIWKIFTSSGTDTVFWDYFLLIFSYILFPAVGAQFLLLSREFRNMPAETAPTTGQQIPAATHSGILLAILLILSVLLLTGSYMMINCTTGNLSKDTCQKIVASFTTRPVNALAPQIQVPPTRYHNIYQKIGASITAPPVNAPTYQMQVFPARYYYSYTKYWIILDPVYNKQVGDKLLVNATTNLPVGEEVRCEIKSGNEYIQLKNQSAGSTAVHVIAGENGLNKIVLSIDTAELVPDVYAHGQKGSVSQAGYSLTEQAGWVNAKNQTFILLDAPVYDISLDPIGDKQFGDIFTVTGRTNIPAGAKIRVTAYPLFNQSNEIMIAESTLIIPEKIGLNKTIATIDTSVFPVVEYDKYRVVEEFRNYFNSNSSIYIAHSGATDFNIGTRPPAPHYILVQECSYNYPGDTRWIRSSSSYNITIVSATNLSTGEDISWELRSIPYEDVYFLNGTPIINGTAKVTKGDAGINKTAVTVDLLTTGDNYGFIILEKGKNEEALGYEMCIPNYRP